MFEDLYEELREAPWMTGRKECVDELTPLLKKAIQRKEKVGVAFSGGLDSCLLAMFSSKFQLYTVGLHGAEDIEFARDAAREMKWPLKIKTITLDEAESTIEKVISILKKNNVECSVT